MVIKGGIQPLRSYLTESNSPMPPTHTGLYTALLIQMMTHEYGDDPERLQSEIEQLQQDMQEHARSNNEKVREFYLANPDKAEAARAKGYKTDAYDFRVGLVDQGLHDPRQWFEEKELLVA